MATVGLAAFITTGSLAAAQTVVYSKAPDTQTAVEGIATTESDRLNIWFDQKFEEELEYSPIRQTTLGRKTNYGDLDDFSTAAEDRQLAWRRAATEEMKSKFDYDKLTPEAKISWDMWLFRLAQAEAAVPFRSNDYVLHHFNGTHAFIPTFLINQHRVESEADMVAYISRLEQSGRALNQLLDLAYENAKAGTRPPRFSYEEIINQAEKITAGAPFTKGEPSAIWKDTLEKIAGLVESKTITEARAESLREQARKALTTKMQPAYARIIDWFKADLPNSDAEARGVSALNNGEAFYNYRLANQTTTNLTADEIHNIGLSEVARIRGEMEAIKDKVNFEGDLQAFFAFLRADDQFYFSEDDKGAQDYIDAAEKHLAFIKTKLPEFFGTLPKADLVVKRVEPFREQDGAAQHYRTGTPDGSRPGTYYAHLSDMRAMPIHSLEVIAYHEGNPGHHMQSSIAQELTGIPKFRAQGGYIPAFGEGWGLYSELLAKEMGAYADPYSDFGRLTTEMWRSIRLVVDTGLHSKGWSQEKAVQYFLANSPIPETAVRSEVKRYLVMPGQATSYKIGMLKILELRAKAEKELGDKLDIRGFHDTVLGGGSVPLNILEKVIDQWIANEKAS
ncbi:DUF885 domain-containing protein [Parasphingorhabdus halotolerans]|uniref:DUF885 domain-containing protein n=2 Tax=Parasphingorhabdus halotolerans TaxID=2725558 RepID=A0A6H2DQW2_9SPHN|nr:DUF885 domain-containing protein [Parasphingorhabdus halotolerans]